MAGTYETQGSKRVYFSDLLPKGDSGATADSLFNFIYQFFYNILLIKIS